MELQESEEGQPDPMESTSAFSVTEMAEQIINGEGELKVMKAFHYSSLTLEHLTHWRHPTLALNIFQLAILYTRVDVVKALGNLCPFFYSDKSMYRHATTRSAPCEPKCTDAREAPVDEPRHDELRKESKHETKEEIKSENVEANEDKDTDTFALNPHLHLACMVGSIDCIKYLLENTCSVYLNQVGYISVTKGENGVYTALECEDYKKGKPFEFCVNSGHIDCVFYFLNNIIIQCLALRFLYAGVREPSSMFHKACSIGCAPLVKLLLKNSFRDVISLSDKHGKTPLHVAVWNGNTETIQQLLDSGASVNTLTESKGCLHILYRSKLHPYNYVANTKLLIQYGINVHITDRNGKSALHILAEEIGISRIDVMRYWKKASEAIIDMTSSEDQNPDTYTMEKYQNDLVTCLELLLIKGMNPNRVTGKSAFSETVLEVLLQYSSLPYTHTTLWNSPDLVYRAVELLLSHKADPNMPSRCSDMPLFTYFVMNHLNDIKEDEMKCKFVHLFILYGADVDKPAMNSCYPAVAVIEKQISPVVLEMIINQMEIFHFQQAMMTIQQRLLPALMFSEKSHEVDYANSVIDVFQRVRMRSLRHFAKATILNCLPCPIEDIRMLPLPTFLKDYLKSDVF